MNNMQQMMQIVNMCKNGNPNQVIQQMMSSNPQAAQSVQSLLNTGKNPEQIVRELAQQRGIDVNQMLSMFK